MAQYYDNHDNNGAYQQGGQQQQGGYQQQPQGAADSYYNSAPAPDYRNSPQPHGQSYDGPLPYQNNNSSQGQGFDGPNLGGPGEDGERGVMGALAGGAAGGFGGHKIGGKTGHSTASAVVGALAGAFIGHKTQDKVSDWRDDRKEEKEEEKRREEDEKRRKEEEKRRRSRSRSSSRHSRRRRSRSSSRRRHSRDRSSSRNRSSGRSTGHYAGAFSSSSRDIRLDSRGDYNLTASCKRPDGSWQSSNISLNRYLENDRGSFRWFSGGGGRSSGGEKTVTVHQGDTLRGISSNYGCSFEEIARHNNISNPDMIYPGQTLRIPGSGGHSSGGGEGNFGATARDVRLTDGGQKIEAELRRDGQWYFSSINLDERIQNDNGTLRFI